MRHRILDAVARKRRAQQIVQIASALMICAPVGGGPITSTNSPRVSSVSADRASSANGPRLISSCILVISRQIAASRPPMIAARSASVSCTRLPDSNSTSVASIRDSSVSRARRAVCFGGRKPSKKNRSVGSAATASAVSTEDGPGSAITEIAGGADLAHQLEAGIGDQGRAGVGDQRDRGALRQLFQDFRPRQRGVVLVIGL